MTDSPPTSFRDKALYKLLKRTFPTYISAQGLLDVPALASAISTSHEGMYKWLRKDRLTVEAAEKLIAHSNGRLKQADLLPHLFRK